MPADEPIDLPDPSESVTVAYVHDKNVTYSWHHSMIQLVGYDWANRGRILAGGYVSYKGGTDGLSDARNKAVQAFLDERPADWLFWIDTDMGFEADTIDRLLAAADPVERPIVGGLCFSQREESSDGMGGWRCRATPTVFDWTVLDSGEMGFSVRWDYPRDTLVRCAGTGAACVLIHRSVFERVAEEFGPVWYDRVPNTTMGQVVSEDLSMCLRAGSIGIPVHVHTGVRTSHQKLLWLAEDDYYGQVALTQLAPQVPPATEEVAVLVPVLGRPEQARPFMESLRATTGLATAYALCDPDDDAAVTAWKEAGAIVVAYGSGGDKPGTFAQKVNLGYKYTREPWVLLVGSDVRFHPGWLDQALDAAADRYHVIGTNDLGNPRVTSGDHATHLLIRRTYIDQVGASWDGPGNVAHEGYRHWYVDDEVVAAAKDRGVWTPALASKVEHLHPAWGKGEMDAVYELGASFAAQDKRLFEQRKADHAH